MVRVEAWKLQQQYFPVVHKNGVRLATWLSMTCAGARRLLECGKNNTCGITCPPRKLVAATAGKQRHRRQQRWPKGAANPTVQRFPAMTLRDSGSSSTSHRTAMTSLRDVPLTRRRAQAPAAGQKSTTDRCLNNTYSCANKAIAEARDVGAIPALPSLPPTGGDASLSSEVSTGPQKRRDYRSRRGDYPLLKQRRGNHDGRYDGAGSNSSDSSGGRRPRKIWCCPTTTSLREEACADLSGMSRPALWRNQMDASKEWEDAHAKLERLRGRFEADHKVSKTGR